MESKVSVARFKRSGQAIRDAFDPKPVRLITPIRGKGSYGIEVANLNPGRVSVKPVVSSKSFLECKSLINLAFGISISNKSQFVDFFKLPHLLVTGASGEEISMGIQVMIASLLVNKHPGQLKFLIIDPVKGHLEAFERLRNHYLAAIPGSKSCVVSDPDRAVYALLSLVEEMEKRYNLLKRGNAWNISEYNEKFLDRKFKENSGHRYLPNIVVVIDEYSGIIEKSGREFDYPLARFAQLSRATGIHLIISTDRPSPGIITDIIKVNIPARVVFKVKKEEQSRLVLAESGAEALTGNGDMLALIEKNPERLQGADFSKAELNEALSFIESQPGYDKPYKLPEPASKS